MLKFITGLMFGTPLRWLYWVFGNYGAAIIALTAVFQIAMIPMKNHQAKQMELSAKANKEILGLREKYKNDPDTFQKEAERIYSKYDVIPFSGIVLSMIQVISFWGLYQVLITPLSSIFGISSNTISALTATAKNIPGFNVQGGELSLMNAVKNNTIAFSAMKDGSIQLINSMDCSFFGINLCANPDLNVLAGWIIPIAVAIATMIPIVKLAISAIKNKNIKQGGLAGLLCFFAFFTIPVAFNFPAGMGLCWITTAITTSIIGIVQNQLFKKERNGHIVKEMGLNGQHGKRGITGQNS